MRGKTIIFPVMLSLFVMLAAGCGKQTAGPTEAGPTGQSSGANAVPAAPTKPVTLQVYVQIPMSDQDWSKFIEEPIKKKFPHVTLEKTDSKANITEQVGAGYHPDLILSGFYYMGTLLDLGLTYDLTDLVKAHKIDLSQFETVTIDSLKGYGNGKLLALPMYQNTTMMFYNKDIFDKFGVSYPKDGMSWPDAVELSRRLTVTDGGTAYQGLAPGSWDTLGSQLSLPKVDPKTNKSVVNSDGYKKVMELLQQVYTIPGMDPKLNSGNGFNKDRRVGMYSYWLSDELILLEQAAQAGQPMNWDMVTTPYFPDKPGIGAKVDAHVAMITDGPNKDQAFELVKYISTSPDVQTLMAQSGRIPALKNVDIQKHFGEDYQSLKGKNTASIFKTKMAPLPPFNKYDDLVAKKPMGTAATEVMTSVSDINTALRKADDAINQQMAAQ